MSSEPNEQDYEKAREIAQISIPQHDASHETDYGSYCMVCEPQEEAKFTEMIEAIATALAEVRAERDALGEAIATAAHKAGIYNNEVPLTGPELILLCENLADASVDAFRRGQSDMATKLDGVREMLDECDNLLVSHHSSTMASGWPDGCHDCPVCSQTGKPNIFSRLVAIKRKLSAVDPSYVASKEKFARDMEETVDNAREALGLKSTHWLVIADQVRDVVKERDQLKAEAATLRAELAEKVKSLQIRYEPDSTFLAENDIAFIKLADVLAILEKGGDA